MKKISFAFKTMKIFMRNQMQDKTNIILDVINMISRCLIVFLLYSYIFKLDNDNIKSISYEASLWSMFIYFVLMILNVRKIYKNIMDDVKSGNVEMYLNRPVNYILFNCYRIIGQGLFSFLFISIVGSIFMVLFIGTPELNYYIFIPSIIITLFFGQILGLIIYSIIGLLAFFIEDVRPIYWVVDKLVMVLGGSYLPISMFPRFMKIIAFISPFGAINFASSTVYESFNDEYIVRIGLQVLWVIVFGIILNCLYKKSREKAMINGG